MAHDIIDSTRFSGLKSHKALPTSRRLSQECNDPVVYALTEIDPAMAYAPQSINPYNTFKSMSVEETPLQLVHRNSILLPPTPPSPQGLNPQTNGDDDLSPLDSTEQSPQTPPPFFEPLTPDTTPPRRPARTYTIARKPVQRQSRPVSESSQNTPSRPQLAPSTTHESERLDYNPWVDGAADIPRAFSQQVSSAPRPTTRNPRLASTIKANTFDSVAPGMSPLAQPAPMAKPRRTVLPDFTEADFAEAMLRRFPRLSYATDNIMASTIVEAAILMPNAGSTVERELRHKRKNRSLRDSGIAMSESTPASSRQVSQSSMEKEMQIDSSPDDSPVPKQTKHDTTTNQSVPAVQTENGLGLDIQHLSVPGTRTSPMALRVSIPKHVSILKTTDPKRSSTQSDKSRSMHAISALNPVTLTPIFTNQPSTPALNPLLLTPFSTSSVISSPGLHQVQHAQQIAVFTHSNDSVKMVTHARKLSRQHDRENLRASALEPLVSPVTPILQVQDEDDVISRISSPSELSVIPIRTSTSRQRLDNLSARHLWPTRMPASAETFVTAHSYIPIASSSQLRIPTPVPLSLRTSPPLFVGNSLGIPQKRVILGPMALVRKLSRRSRRRRAKGQEAMVREMNSNDAMEANQSALVALQNRSRWSQDSTRAGRFWRWVSRGGRRVGLGRAARVWGRWRGR